MLRQRRSRRLTTVLAGAAAAAMATALGLPSPAQAGPGTPAGTPTAVGTGGAVATVDANATRVGLDVLRAGGNATDAAVAAAATLGVTEPFSSGIGGGGFFVHYDAATGRVQTIDGRETAPQDMTQSSFLDENGQPLPFSNAVTSGLSIGVPGTAQTWQNALDRWGTLSLSQALRRATQVAARGFVVDETFRSQVASNETRFSQFPATRELFLPGGQPPAVGSIFRNPDLAATYAELGGRGVDWLYNGRLGAEVVDTAKNPPIDPTSTYFARPGLMERSDLAAYEAPFREPTHIGYRGRDVYGMPPPSSGGSTVGEALNILENANLSEMSRTQALHHYLEASALSFADRNKYVGDPAYVDVPLDELLSDGFAKERFCQIDPAHALSKPVPAGSADGAYDTDCGASAGATAAVDHEGLSTTHITTADKWGNVVAYTLTIEQIGGSGITVPGRGFLLNNELTDFNFVPATGGTSDPNLPAGGKRPRSSMAPTIVLDDGSPLLAVGSPGGSTIITTVLQILVNRLDLGMTLPQAIAEPRVTQRNSASVQAEPTFDAVQKAALEALGHTFTTNPEIGAATGIEFLGNGQLLAAAEPVRRGGGTAGVVTP